MGEPADETRSGEDASAKKAPASEELPESEEDSDWEEDSDSEDNEDWEDEPESEDDPDREDDEDWEDEPESEGDPKSDGPPILENVSRIDRGRYMEAARAELNNRRNIIFCVLAAVIVVIGLVRTMIGVLLLGIVILLLILFYPRLIGRRDYRKLCRLHPEGSWTKTVRFYEDHLETDSGTGAPTVVRYQDIQRKVETRRMYVIDFGKACPATTLCKDGFTDGGSIEQLKDFLEERQHASDGKIKKS